MAAILCPVRVARPTAMVMLTALIVGACGTATTVDDTEASAAPTIIATSSIWADIVANVACDGVAQVENLIPVGADPHGYEPSLADRARLESASLVVANGLGLEEGIDDTLDAAAGGGGPQLLRMGDHIDTIAYHADPDTPDPHVWFDPIRISDALPALADRLVSDVGLDAAQVDGCLVDYQRQLAEVDRQVAETVGDIPVDRRALVTNHDALGYLADRYDFEVIGTVIPAGSGLAETNPAWLAELADVIEENDVHAIFAEAQHGADDADALAGRLDDVEVISLLTGTLGDESGGTDTYIGLLLSTAELIADGLR